MALSEGFADLGPLSNGGSSTVASPPATNTSADSHQDQVVMPSKIEPEQPAEQTEQAQCMRNGALRTNGTARLSSSGSSSSSHGTDSQRFGVLLPNALSPPCCVCCSLRQPVCCSGNQRACALYPNAVSSGAVHVASCSVQGIPCFCMQHHWQEHLQNQPNMATLR